jgi:hypothetical protein
MVVVAAAVRDASPEAAAAAAVARIKWLKTVIQIRGALNF